MRPKTLCCAGRGDLARCRIRSAGESAKHLAQRCGSVQRRPRLHQGAGQVRRVGRRNTTESRSISSCTRTPRWASRSNISNTCPRASRRLRHRLARAYVDVLEGGAVHRCALPVPEFSTGTRCSMPTAQARRRRGREKADVMLIGYAGGGIRNIFINKPMGSLADIKGLKVRVQGAPIWSKTFRPPACRRR